jgi:hypothetical protein
MSVTNKPDFLKAIEFAASLPTSRMHLTAIHPDSKSPPRGKSFNKSEAGRAAALTWITEGNSKGWGVYFNCNEVQALGAGHAKAKETEVSTMHFVHVDVDPPEGTSPENMAAARAAMLERINAAQPSLIINSGNGFGCFWAIDPEPVTADNLLDLKGRNKAMAAKLSGDSCFDLCRVMRLPFTINIPNKKKRDAGRVPVLADVVEDGRDLITYSLADFSTAAVEASAEATRFSGSGSAYADIGLPDIPEAVSLSKLDAEMRKLVRKGPAEGKDRSAEVYRASCALREEGWSDGDILCVLTNASNGIADHIFDQKQRTPIEQASRVIDRMNRDRIASGSTAPEDFTAEPYSRTKVKYRAQNMPLAVYDAMNAIRADKKRDHIFQRGPDIIRLNQMLTEAELNGAKPTDVRRKRGALVIREVVADYMAFRLAEAARFFVKTKPMGRPKTTTTEKVD